MAGNELILVIRADDKASKQLKNVGKQTDNLGSKFKTMGKAGAAAFAVAATAAAAYGVKSALSFSKSQAQVRTLISVTDQEFQKLNDSTLEFAGSMNVAAADASKALYDALSGGVQRSEVIPFLEDAARAAHAGGASLTEAVGILVQAQNVYGSTVLSAAEASDVLFEVIRGGITTLPELGAVLGRVLPTAAALGVSFQDVGSSLSVMTSRTADTAGSVTRLNALFVAALRDSSMLAKAIKSELGGSFQDLIASGKTTSEIMQSLRDRLPYDQFLQLFRRVEALNGALLITGKQNAPAVAAAFQDMTDAAGATKTAFDKVAESSGFKFETGINDLKIAVLKLAEETLPLLLEGVNLLGFVLTPLLKLLELKQAIDTGEILTESKKLPKFETRDGELVINQNLFDAIISRIPTPVLIASYSAMNELQRPAYVYTNPPSGFRFGDETGGGEITPPWRARIGVNTGESNPANLDPLSAAIAALADLPANWRQVESMKAKADPLELTTPMIDALNEGISQLEEAMSAAAEEAALWPPLFESNEAALNALIPLWDDYNTALAESTAAQIVYESAVADAASEASSASTELTDAMRDQLLEAQRQAESLGMRINLEDTYNHIVEVATEELEALNAALEAAIESGEGLAEAQAAYDDKLADLGKDWDKSVEKTMERIADEAAAQKEKDEAEAERKREEQHREMMRINAIQVRLATKSLEEVAGSQELIGMTKKQMAVIYQAAGLNQQARNAAQSGIGALMMGGVFSGMTDAQFATATGQELGTRSTSTGAGYARIASQDPRFAHLSGQVARTNTVMALNPNDPNSPGVIVSAGGKITVVNIAGNYIPLGPDTGDAVIEAANIAKDSRGTQFHTGIVAESQ